MEVEVKVEPGRKEPRVVILTGEDSPELQRLARELAGLQLGPIQVREVSKMTGAWADAGELTRHLPEMETWSQIVWAHRALWDPVQK